MRVVHHGGDLAGYHSDMMWLPDYGVGAVILTNADSGVIIRGPAAPQADGGALRREARGGRLAQGRRSAAQGAIAKERERLVVPADPAAVAKLAGRYANKSLGEVEGHEERETVTFDVGEWKSTVASRKNDDGTTSFITIDPSLGGFDFVVADKDGKRHLIMRDAQHEYVF